MSAVRLVPFCFGEHGSLVPALTDRLHALLHVPVSVERPAFNPELAYDRSRGQYGSTLLLECLLAQTPDDGGRVLGVTAVDLFIPVLTYVFGEAQLGGRAAVVSTHRLDPRAYGLPADVALLLDRLTKESVHELGHTLGLVHCDAVACVMRTSTYVEEIDLKPPHPCARCREAAGRGNGL